MQNIHYVTAYNTWLKHWSILTNYWPPFKHLFAGHPVIVQHDEFLSFCVPKVFLHDKTVFYASAVMQLDWLCPRKIQVKLQALRSSHMPAQLGWEQATSGSSCAFVHLSTRKPPAQSFIAPWSVMVYEITCHLKTIISYIYVLYLNSPVCNLLLYTGCNSLKAKCSGLGTDVGFFWATLEW